MGFLIIVTATCLIAFLWMAFRPAPASPRPKARSSVREAATEAVLPSATEVQAASAAAVTEAQDRIARFRAVVPGAQDGEMAEIPVLVRQALVALMRRRAEAAAADLARVQANLVRELQVFKGLEERRRQGGGGKADASRVQLQMIDELREDVAGIGERLSPEAWAGLLARYRAEVAPHRERISSQVEDSVAVIGRDPGISPDDVEAARRALSIHLDRFDVLMGDPANWPRANEVATDEASAVRTLGERRRQNLQERQRLLDQIGRLDARVEASKAVLRSLVAQGYRLVAVTPEETLAPIVQEHATWKRRWEGAATLSGKEPEELAAFLEALDAFDESHRRAWNLSPSRAERRAELVAASRALTILATKHQKALERGRGMDAVVRSLLERLEACRQRLDAFHAERFSAFCAGNPVVNEEVLMPLSRRYYELLGEKDALTREAEALLPIGVFRAATGVHPVPPSLVRS